jgi:GT2 family glycosyltransferase
VEESVDEAQAYVPGSVIPAIIDGGEWSASFGLSWTDLMLRDQAAAGRIIRPNGQYLRKVAGTMGVAAGRNEIARTFLATDAEWLFMVDTDMGFDPDTVDRLVESAERNGVKILGALCFAQKLDPNIAPGPSYAVRYRIQPTLYRFTEIQETGEKGFQSITKYLRNSFQLVGATGAACLLVHRDALAEVGPDPFTPLTVEGAGGNGTARMFSEDLSFCVRASAAGLDIGVDTSIKTSHYKGGIYLDEIQFAMQQETLIQAKGHEIAKLAQWAANRGASPLGVR